MEEHPQIDWSGLIGLRIIHAHHYEGIMYDLVWEVIKRDIPELKNYLQKLL
ncbi:HepT-like ribonuclease domain-containing protein [Methanosphaera sp. BMS]|uniref:HepT-like ribonuclease domain-containing protein n=1 Tax=Methanosphaera sp. BMS TaxID=1789762 RepID=UPI000DD4549D